MFYSACINIVIGYIFTFNSQWVCADTVEQWMIIINNNEISNKIIMATIKHNWYEVGIVHICVHTTCSTHYCMVTVLIVIHIIKYGSI